MHKPCFSDNILTKVMVSNVLEVIPTEIVVKKTLKQAKKGHHIDIPPVLTCINDNLTQLNIILDP